MISRRLFLSTALATGALACLAVPTFAETPVQGPFDLTFDPTAFTVNETTVDTAAGPVKVVYHFYKAMPYVAHPVDVAHQSLTISVPVEINGRAVDASKAPIVLSNSVGGYFPSSFAKATGVDEGAGMPPRPAAPPAEGGTSATPTFSAGQMQRGVKVSNAKLALAAGLVVVEPGARGRTLVDASGTYYGTAPAAIVDLKAAVRWLRHNEGRVPGNTNWIVSAGTSAGGGLSALLGASGDAAAYLPHLQALGAADASDAIFAIGAWCPITDLENADAAYEWNWGALALGEGVLDTALSAELAAAFPAYQASLGLVADHGLGALTAETYPAHLLQSFLLPAATAYLAALTEPTAAPIWPQTRMSRWKTARRSLAGPIIWPMSVNARNRPPPLTRWTCLRAIITSLALAPPQRGILQPLHFAAPRMIQLPYLTPIWQKPCR